MRAAAAGAPVVSGTVRDDPQKPRPERSAGVEARHRPPRSLCRLLDHVVCSVRTSEHDRRDPERGGSMASHEVAIGVGVAAEGAPDGQLLEVVDPFVLVPLVSVTEEVGHQRVDLRA